MSEFAMVTQGSTNQHFKRQSNQQLKSVNSLINSDLHKQSRDCNNKHQSHFKRRTIQQLTSANCLTNFDFQFMASEQPLPTFQKTNQTTVVFRELL